MLVCMYYVRRTEKVRYITADKLLGTSCIKIDTGLKNRGG